MAEQNCPKKKKSRYFETFISKLLQTMHGNPSEIADVPRDFRASTGTHEGPPRTNIQGITRNAKQQLNSAICHIATFLSKKSAEITILIEKRTISDKEIESCVKMYFTPEFAEYLINKANIARKLYTEEKSGKSTKGKRIHNSRQKRAGIIFPPALVEKFLRSFGYSKLLITGIAPIFLASILENITLKILENSAEKAPKARIAIRDLEIGVREDFCLDSLFRVINITFIGGGVKTFIHDSLLTKRPRKKREISSVENERKHRFRPGTVSLREIRKYQKTSNCLIFAKFPFERSVRKIVGKYAHILYENHTDNQIKISKDTFIVLQYYIEQFLIDFLQDVNAIAVHSGRIKIVGTDIKFLHSLRKYPFLHQENEV